MCQLIKATCLFGVIIIIIIRFTNGLVEAHVCFYLKTVEFL